MADESEVLELLKAGVHFGHKKSKWNPKMAPYIYTFRNNIAIIDLEKTLEKLSEALEFIKKVVKERGDILFVGTKTSAQGITEATAKECGMPYVTERWLGGTFTNFKVLLSRIKYLNDLEAKLNPQNFGFEKYTKKERHDMNVEYQRLMKKMGGIKTIKELPRAVFIVDPVKDSLAAKEAKRKNISIIALIDTNADPTNIDYPVPSNDDAIASLKFMLGKVKDAILEAKGDLSSKVPLGAKEEETSSA